MCTIFIVLFKITHILQHLRIAKMQTTVYVYIFIHNQFYYFYLLSAALPLPIGLLIGAISYSKGGCFIFNVKLLYWYCCADYPFNQYN